LTDWFRVRHLVARGEGFEQREKASVTSTVVGLAFVSSKAKGLVALA